MSNNDPMKPFYATKMEVLDLIGHFQKVHRVVLELSYITLTHTNVPRDQIDRLTASMDAMLDSFDQVVKTSQKNFPGIEADE
ncbi:hypothetical protein HRR99_03115 [Agrobacterium vaccinii]|uniref:hypothetical protein n=1 Tax=Agrobacterium vaccinii TaxID=2735528 RepID=UPI001E44A780|nr:hypothetical protein [Agrobacterium vaccinii]UHS60581.1 hypothetical protein HRR99_03115 [Agrobacterium vaccinii]